MIWEFGGETVPLFSVQHPHLTSWTVGKSQVFHKHQSLGEGVIPQMVLSDLAGSRSPQEPFNPEIPMAILGGRLRLVALKSVGLFVSSIRANIDSYWLQQPPCPPEVSVCHVNRS